MTDRLGDFDWARLGDEAVDLLRAYLRIDTTNPPGNEVAGSAFLAVSSRATTSRSRPRSRRRDAATCVRAAGRHRIAARAGAASPHRCRARGSPGLDRRSVRRRHRRRLPLRARRARHEVRGDHPTRGALALKRAGIRLPATSCSSPPPTRRTTASSARSSSRAIAAAGSPAPTRRSRSSAAFSIASSSRVRSGSSASPRRRRCPCG